ncbi:MAG: hypothetical protein JXB00_02775 [Bacteroidales bacterium]|nr:hypothetical protein [Bacteroidales bacterium]
MKALTVIFFSSWKFAATFPFAVYVLKMNGVEILLYTNLGGIIGALTFLYFSELFIRLWNRYWPEKLKFGKSDRKLFTKGNRRIIRIKSKYGLTGIVILSPVLLSIPVGAFLTVKYYGLRTKNILWLIAGQVSWSVIYTFFYLKIKTAVF